MRLAARAIRLILATIALLLIGSTLALASPEAVTKSVTIQNFTYNPTPITVNVGDSITWTNADQAAHSAKSTTGAFDTTILTTGQSKTLTFTAAGTFAYICGVHGASMSGSVVVQSAATPAPTPVPTVRTPAPTPAPTAAPTEAPTEAPTPSPTLAPTPSATAAPTTAAPTATAAASTTAPVAAASPTPAPIPAAQDNTALLIGGAVVAVAAVGGIAFVLLRR